MPSESVTDRLRRLRCVVVIPTFDNAGTIAAVVSDVRRYAADVIVVDDGSHRPVDEVLGEGRPDGVRVIRYAPNRGKGYALRRGLDAAREAGFRYAVTIDADGQHFASDLERFADEIERSPDALLVGARNLAADNMPSRNTFANRFSNFWYRVETGRRLDDTQSGYRLYPLEPLRGMRFLSRRYEFEVEVIVRAAWRGVEVRNIPVGVYYPPAAERVSHFRPSVDFIRISLLNTYLVLAALLWYYPFRFFRSLTRENIRRFFERNVLHAPDSNLRMAAAMGFGVFCGIVPLWGYQMIFAGVAAHFLRLNKVVAVVFSNVSIPPMIPFILYGSYLMGGVVLGRPASLSIGDMSLERLGESLAQYLAGSFVLAVACGAAVTAVAYVVMKIFKRSERYE